MQQERCAHREAWDLAKIVKTHLNTRYKATFCFPTEAWVMAAPSSKKPEEREFVVDSGASMHMLSKKDVSSAEQETLQTSRSPTTVNTANGEVQTSEEAEVYVHDLELFFTVQILDDTTFSPVTRQAVRRTRLYQRVGHLTKNGTRILCNTENFVPVGVPALSTSSSASWSSTHTPRGRRTLRLPLRVRRPPRAIRLG